MNKSLTAVLVIILTVSAAYAAEKKDESTIRAQDKYTIYYIRSDYQDVIGDKVVEKQKITSVILRRSTVIEYNGMKLLSGYGVSVGDVATDWQDGGQVGIPWESVKGMVEFDSLEKLKAAVKINKELPLMNDAK